MGGNTWAMLCRPTRTTVRSAPRCARFFIWLELRGLGRWLTSVSGSPLSLLSESRCGGFLNVSSQKAAQEIDRGDGWHW